MNHNVKLTSDELNKHLNEQLMLMELLCENFDTGKEVTAKPLANILRLLFKDNGKNAHSLLGQLGKLDGKFFDSAIPFTEGSLMTHGGLVFIAMEDNNTRYVAMLDEIPFSKWITFDEWWNAEIFIDDQKRKLTRKSLVLTAVEQDAGTHVDPALEPTYSDLVKNNSLGWTVHNNNNVRPMDRPEKAAIRQICHETLKSLMTNYTKKRPPSNVGMFVGGVSVRPATPEEIAKSKKYPKTGRNQMCPCGSKIKFKRCHGKI